jgi:hypothetical protein
MPVEIVKYTEKHIDSVIAFNQRLKEGGSSWGFFDSNIPDWVPLHNKGDSEIWNEHFLAIDEDEIVRGGYVFKSQPMQLLSQPTTVSSWQGPVTEGLINNKYNTVVISILMQMTRQNQNLFCWGASNKLSKLLETLKWHCIKAPFLIHISNTNNFLRLFPRIRSDKRLATLASTLANTGIAFVLNKVLKTFNNIKNSVNTPSYKTIECTEFGSWADTVWEQAKNQYTFSGIKTSKNLNRILDTNSWPHPKIIRFERDSKTIGWVAYRIKEFIDDPRFGALKVGTILDCLALPNHEHHIIHNTCKHIDSSEVDIICTNLTNKNWVKACSSSGFFSFPSRFLAFSETLVKQTENLKAFVSHSHITLIDGDGPRGF